MTGKDSSFTNFETKAFYTWIYNTPSIYEEFRFKASEAMEAAPEDLDGQITALIHELKDYCQGNAPAIPSGFYMEVLTAGLERIKFWEVAETLIKDYTGEPGQEGTQDH